MSPVQKGDIISFALDAKREVTVTWSQSLSPKSEPYYAIAAINTSRGRFDVQLLVNLLNQVQFIYRQCHRELFRPKELVRQSAR